MPGDAVPTERLMAEVLSHYDLAPSIECTILSSGLNDVYLVTTGLGPFILKLYRAGWRSQAEVLDEVEVLFHLQRKGVPVGLPVARRDGTFVQTLAVPEGQRQAVLYTHAKGSAVTTVDEAGCRLFGRTLAELHRATDDFVPQRVRCDLEHLLDRPLRALEPLLEDRAEDREYLRGLGQRLRERVAALPPATLDWGFCHGDFRPANAHLDESTGLLTLYDFEVAGAGFRAYDLATIRFYLTGVGRGEDQEALWQAFLTGYTGSRPLSAVDQAALPLFVMLRPIRIFGTLLQTARKNWSLEAWPPSQGGPLPSPDFFAGTLQFLREWESTRL
jgi:Ser/Thr protein kinase RdoA (MazF antagonist)